MSHRLRLRSWLFAAIFWILFAGSIGLSPRFPWLNFVWVICLLLYFAIGSIYAIVVAHRRNDETSFAVHRAVYRWWRSLALDEDEYPDKSKA